MDAHTYDYCCAMYDYYCDYQLCGKRNSECKLKMTPVHRVCWDSESGLCNDFSCPHHVSRQAVESMKAAMKKVVMQEEIDPKGIDKKMLADALCIVSRANAEQPVGIKVVEKEVPVEVKVPVEKIVEKCIEVPVIKEVIKEVKVPVEVEVPVEKVIEKEVIKEVVNELDEEKLAALCAII